MTRTSFVLEFVPLRGEMNWSHAHKTRFWYRLGFFFQNFRRSPPTPFIWKSPPPPGAEILPNYTTNRSVHACRSTCRSQRLKSPLRDRLFITPQREVGWFSKNNVYKNFQHPQYFLIKNLAVPQSSRSALRANPKNKRACQHAITGKKIQPPSSIAVITDVSGLTWKRGERVNLAFSGIVLSHKPRLQARIISRCSGK